MPKFAHFNPAANPSPVIAWYDTEAGEWPKLPSSDYLLQITEAQWAQRGTGWQVSNRLLLQAPGVSLLQAQASQLALVHAAYEAATQITVAYMGTTFQADTGSQDTLNKTLSAMTPSGATPAGFYWTDALNNQVMMTLAQLQGLAGEMITQGWAAFKHQQMQKTAIRAAATVADVQSITW